MPWIVVDPKNATRDGTKVARVGVPYFPDEIDYESILEAGFGGEQFREWREAGGVVILATGTGYERLEKLMGSDYADVPESTVRDETTKLALERQVVVLKWVSS